MCIKSSNIATRSYLLSDFDDDDNRTESPNLFSKRLKTDHSSTIINKNPSRISSTIPSNPINDTESFNNNELSN